MAKKVNNKHILNRGTQQRVDTSKVKSSCAFFSYSIGSKTINIEITPEIIGRNLEKKLGNNQ